MFFSGVSSSYFIYCTQRHTRINTHTHTYMHTHHIYVYIYQILDHIVPMDIHKWPSKYSTILKTLHPKAILTTPSFLLYFFKKMILYICIYTINFASLIYLRTSNTHMIPISSCLTYHQNIPYDTEPFYVAWKDLFFNIGWIWFYYIAPMHLEAALIPKESLQYTLYAVLIISDTLNVHREFS